jgi:hypothetical protein
MAEGIRVGKTRGCSEKAVVKMKKRMVMIDEKGNVCSWKMTSREMIIDLVCRSYSLYPLIAWITNENDKDEL